MNRYEIDFRRSWVASTFRALKSGFRSIREKGKRYSWFDGQWQLEYAEAIFGAAFVVAQAYILGTSGDINKIREGAGKKKMNKHDYYADDPNPLPKAGSRIKVINAVANYYKHHDEWMSGWEKNADTKLLAKVGVDKDTEFPCYEVTKKLIGKDCYKLEKLLTIMSDWRRHLLSKYTS